MDSAPTPIQLLWCNSGIHQFQTQEIKEDLQVQEAKLILIPLAKKIDAEDEGATTLCGIPAAMDSAQLEWTSQLGVVILESGVVVL